MDKSELKYYYLKDHLVGVRADRGSVVEAREYYAFGMEMAGRSYVSGTKTKESYTGHERDAETGLLYAGARYYDSAIARWLVVDPKAHWYPGMSPYNYVVNNPVSLVDPDGREVRCRTEEECQQAADDLNAAHENHKGDANITVEETKWEESASVWWNPLTWGKTETVSGFRLSTANSNFDWGQDEYTLALYDVINTTENIFSIQYVPGNTDITGWPIHGTAFDTQARANIGAGGGTIVVSADGNKLGEPTGVILMHELVGHGHPAGGN